MKRVHYAGYAHGPSKLDSQRDPRIGICNQRRDDTMKVKIAIALAVMIVNEFAKRWAQRELAKFTEAQRAA